MSTLRELLRRIFRKLFRGNSIEILKKRGLSVGHNFNMMGGVILDHSHIWHIEIGNDVTLAPRVVILAHDASTKRSLGYTRLGKVKIGSRVFVEAGSIVLPGVTIGDDVVIGAGSVVSRDIPGGSVAVGNPALVIRPLDTFLKAKTEEMTISPCFDETYTIRKNVTDDMKREMNQRMVNGVGYVV